MSIGGAKEPHQDLLAPEAMSPMTAAMLSGSESDALLEEGAVRARRLSAEGCSAEVREAVAADPALRSKVEAVGLAGQLLPKPVAGQRTPDAAERAEEGRRSAARLAEPGPRAEAERSGLSAPPTDVEWKRGAAELLQRAARPGVKLPENLSPDDTAAVAEEDFELPSTCSVCHKPKSRSLGLVLSTGTHLRCKPAHVRAQAKKEAEELREEKDDLKKDLSEVEAEVEERDAQIEAVIAHPEVGPVAAAIIESTPTPAARAARDEEQLALAKVVPRCGWGGASDGSVLHVLTPREPGEEIHLFPLQDFGAYPFGKDRPATIQALCGKRTSAETRDLEPTVAVLPQPTPDSDANSDSSTSRKAVFCGVCAQKFTTGTLLFPAWVRPSQWGMSASPAPVFPTSAKGRRVRR
jgi:hypothetical protein